jgi:glyoxylase I family protein
MENIQGVHHIAMNASDFDKTIKFYKEVLDFKEAIAWGDMGSRACMLDIGDGTCLEIFEGGSKEIKIEGAFIHLALKTKNCDQVTKLVRESGMKITKEPSDVVIKSNPPTPARIAFSQGPEGEIVELFQNR